MLEIDGVAMSGSGMIVRQAVAYAAVQGTPIRVINARARRPQPGLRAQHLCAVEAVRVLVGGETEGVGIGSREFTFWPGEARPAGRYRFDVGTAGSATALALAVLPVLATAGQPVEVELVGGLFQDRAPSAFHLQHVLLTLLGRMGFGVSMDLVRPGYVPTGGGVVRLRTSRATQLTPLHASEQAPVQALWGIALSSHLQERRVSTRMADAARRVLTEAGHQAIIEEREDTSAAQAGAGLAVFADLADGMRLGADRAGARGRSAERIGAAAAHLLLQDLRSGATVDRFAADQILVFAALASGRTTLRLAAMTEHVRTGLWLADTFGFDTWSVDRRLLVFDGRGL